MLTTANDKKIHSGREKARVYYKYLIGEDYIVFESKHYEQCDQIWRVPAKFGGFRHSCGGQNFGVAVGGCGGLLNKMRKMRQFFTKLPKFLAVAANFGGIQSSWGGFAENCLVTLTMKKV